MKIKLTFKGMDSWDRPVYEDENGRLWKDVDPRKNRKADLCTVQNNEFDGEPSTNMCYIKQYENVKIKFIPERITW
ncbi:MAG: hypothetical protein WCR17_07130 [Candidatus Methanomethylophilaceae archaeon]|jgi:hypothetical protein